MKQSIKKFLKSLNWLYGISIIVAIYFTYLFCRMWILGKKGILAIAIVLVVGALVLTNQYLKRNKKFFIKKRKHRIIMYLEVFAISLLIIMGGRKFFTYNYDTSEIKIQSVENENLSFSVIDAIIVNNLVYSRYDNTFNNDYDAISGINRNYVEVFEDNGILTVRTKKSYSVKIVFNYSHEELEIDENGHNLVRISSEDKTTIYMVKDINNKDSYTVIRFLCSFISIFYIVYLLFNYIINPNNKRQRYVILIGIITLGLGIFYINDCSISISPDSYTYIDFDFSALLDFKPSGRTPIYPMIINGIKFIFVNNFLEFVVIFQYVLWFISILFLFKTVELLTNSQKLSFLATVLYALAPFAVIWNGSILTESIALSGTIYFIYYIIKYIKTDKVMYGNISIILSLALTFLRPTAIIYLLGLLIFIIMKLIFEKGKKCDIKCLITEVICLAFVVFYMICFHNVFGIYSISDAVVRQDLMVTMREGFYKSSNDEEFILNIEEAYKNNPDNEWKAMTEVLIKYPLAKTKELTNYCRKKSMNKYVWYIVDLIKNHSKIKFEGYAFINMNPNSTWIHDALYSSFAIMTFLHVYLLICIEVVLMIINWIKSKTVPWIHCGLFFFPLVIVISSFIGTCGEYMRTAVCCVPFAYLIFVMLLYDFFIRKAKKNERIY